MELAECLKIKSKVDLHKYFTNTIKEDTEAWEYLRQYCKFRDNIIYQKMKMKILQQMKKK